MKKTVKKSIFTTVKESSVEISLIIFVSLGLAWMVIPGDASANVEKVRFSEEAVAMQVEAIQNEFKPSGILPTAEMRDPIKTMTVPVTAYNSVPWQTDDTPCIGAQGTDICKYLAAGSNTCAANFVPLGTVLEVEDLGTCVVRDRMNSRYYYRIDWYMGDDVAGARSFGIKTKDVGIYAS